MEKGKIRRLNKELSDELKEAEEFFINEAEEKTEEYIEKYTKLESSFKGKYICSDLFKETFSKYTESIESRKKYAEVIHNSAAVLSNELFVRNVQNKNAKKCIFLSGVPGAGKSFLIQSLFLTHAIDDDTIIFEGDITSKSILEKMEIATQNSLELYILIVNPTLELAQRNAISRHFEIGRGASSQTMARIMSGIPAALVEIKEKFPTIELGIYNKKTNYDIEGFIGFEHSNLLEHGTYDEILDELLSLRDKIIKEIEEDLKKKAEIAKEEGEKIKDEGEGVGKGTKS